MKNWWKEAVVYQIYPRSFNDSNGDGIGDINGIIEKLDYVKGLGIDIIWLSPVYKSPNDDNGYDISDYRSIMDDFGTIEDWENMLEQIHSKGLKLIMDLVVNHTSDEHAWFIESRSSKDNPKRDYYIWRDGRDGAEPNNWESYFSIPAWTYDENSEQYYLHLFTKKQPDLNWENPKVVDEVFDMMKWWLDKGIDGFRMDVINLIGKPEGMPDSVRFGERYDGYVFDPALYANNAVTHTYLKEMRKKVLSKYDVMTVGETPMVTPDIALEYVDAKNEELDMVFNFEHVESVGNAVPKGFFKIMLFVIEELWNMILHGSRKFDVFQYKDLVSRWYTVIERGGWNSQYFSNHDQPRQVSKFGDVKTYHRRSAKMLATLIHTLPGTPYVYQGEEIGMTNIKLPSIDDYRDVATINAYKKAVDGGIPAAFAMMAVHSKSRDNARTPMQWNSEKNAGFSAGTPWLRVNPNYKKINAEKQANDPVSILNYYKKIISLRKENDSMVYGDFNIIDPKNRRSISYIRSYENKKLLVIINLTGKRAHAKVDKEIELSGAKVILSNVRKSSFTGDSRMNLRPYEAAIIEL